MMQTVTQIIKSIKAEGTAAVKKSQAHFGITGINNYGLSRPQIRELAKKAGKNHELALALWKTGIHEARHIAILVAEEEKLTRSMMEGWMRDFNSWDIVDSCCGDLFCHSPQAYDLAKAWSARMKEFEKRAGFAMMAMLAVHDKAASDKKFEQFFPFLLKESEDKRNFVKKAVNWALRQIGKRNVRLCRNAIYLARQIREKGDPASRWIATDALRELESCLAEGKVKDIGRK